MLNSHKIVQRIRNNSGVRLYGSNFFWLLLERCLRIGIGFFVSICVVRQLGPGFFGQLNYALSYCAIFSFMLDLCASQIAVRELVKYPNQSTELLLTILLMRLTGFVCMMVLMLPGIWLSKEKLDIWLIIFIALSYLAQALQAPEYFFQARAQGKIVASVQLGFFLLYSGGRLSCVWFGLPLVAYAVVETAAAFFSAIMYWGIYHFRERPGHYHFAKSSCKQILSSSWGLMLSSACGIFYARIDQVLIGNLSNNTNLGYYSLAVRLTELWYFIPIVLVNAFFPALVNASIRDKQQYMRRIGRLYLILFWGALVFCICCCCWGTDIIVLLYGPQFQLAGKVLQIYCWRMMIVAFSALFGPLTANDDLHKEFLWLSLSLALIGGGLEWWLLKQYGFIGAAWGFVLAPLVNNTLFGILVPKLRHHYLLFLKSIFNFKLLNFN